MGVKVDFKPMGYWNRKLIDSFWQTKQNDQEEAYKAVEILDAKYKSETNSQASFSLTPAIWL